MKLTQLNLKHFGKFSDKKIELSEGINVFYGENEAGKSTIFSFLEGMLFGMEKGRGRATYQDAFRRYEPWENSNYYAGSIRFISGGKNFLLERNFDKYAKNAMLLCEDDGEELSVEQGDLEMLLGELNKDNYSNTIAVGQLKAETNVTLAGELRNYAANYYSTGNSEIDLEGAMSELRTQKKEIEKEIKGISLKKQEKRNKIEQETSYIWKDLEQLKQEKEELKQKKEKMLKPQEMKQVETSNEKGKIILFVAIILSMVALIVLAFIFIPKPWNYVVSLLVLLMGMIYAGLWITAKARMRQRINKGKYQEEVDNERVRQEVQWKEKMLGESIVEKGIEYQNLEEQLKELSEQDTDYKAQDKRREGIDLALLKLSELSSQINREVGDKLNIRASEILASITKGRYEKVWIDEDLSMNIVTQDRQVAVEQLSQGTLEQVYFALRMAASEILHGELYPIILDDTFAYYDEGRMGRTLNWLAKSKRQVLLFTCHKRELEFLEENNISYNNGNI